MALVLVLVLVLALALVLVLVLVLVAQSIQRLELRMAPVRAQRWAQSPVQRSQVARL